ncbi:MAG: signal peptidase I [Gordonia sp. (in: high G+C Gram-positive bacteria)]|uniref:signal peptidase I n=1 Tax=Gordonia sp. (in: high G+C Gram-positive bacteria) TaxID=84139 RepID=UPI0039E3C9B5
MSEVTDADGVNDENDSTDRPWKSKKDKSDEGGRSFVTELAIIVGIVLIISWLGQTFVFRQYVVPSQSMEKTLIGGAGPNGEARSNDRIVIDKLVYRFGDPRPGDVIVFKAPSDDWDGGVPLRDGSTFRGKVMNVLSWFGYAPPNEYSLVKRVIATGGQSVECRNEGDGAGFKVDGKPLTEPYIDKGSQIDDRPCFGEDFGPVKVPDGNVWVMGDNRSQSADSRFHMTDQFHGTVPRGDIRGKVRFKMWPIKRIGGVGSVNPQK